MKTTALVNIDAKNILKSLGLGAGEGQGGAAQKFFAVNVARHCDKYVPFKKGTLKNNVSYVNNYEGIKYIQPYAKFHYYGKVMVDPQTGSSYARRGVKKIVTQKDLNHAHSPVRGAFWERRMWAADGKTILEELRKFILGRPGGKP